MRRSEIIGLLTVAALGVGALATGAHVAATIEDGAAAEARAALASVGFQNLDVNADGLTIEVDGRVKSAREREIVIATLEGLPNLGAIVDNVVVVEPLVDLRPAVLRVQKDDRALTLTGEAPNAEARDLLASRASIATGGVEFLNLMKAQDRRASESWLRAAEAAIDAVAALRVGQASVERDVFRLEGAAADAETREGVLTRLAAAVGDDFTLEVDITAPPPLVSPYGFTAVKLGDTIDIRLCHAPDAGARSTILGALRARDGEAPADAARDLCPLANGAPNERWTEAVLRAMAALEPLDDGEVRIVDDRVRLTGFVDDADAAPAAGEAAAEGWPDLYTVIVDVRETPPVARPFTMTAVKRPGDVRLTGVAPSLERADAWAAALGATNELELARGAPSDWAAAADLAVTALAEMKIGALTIADESILLSAPGDPSDRERLRERLSAMLPSGYRLEVAAARGPTFLEPPVGGPDASASTGAGATVSAPSPTASGGYGFSARRAVDRTVALAGSVEDDASRAVVAAYARAQLGGEALTNDLAAGDGPAPEGWRRALFAGLEALGKLEEGELVVEPSAIYLRGRVSEAGAVREAAAALEEKAPEGFARFSRIAVSERGLDASERAGPPLGPEACVAETNAIVAETPIRFETGSAAIDAASEPVIAALARALARCPTAAIAIGGHTDSAGGEEDNLALSRSRAAAVEQSLVARGADPSRLVSEGYGETRPIAENDSDAGRARNRRIEFTLGE